MILKSYYQTSFSYSKNKLKHLKRIYRLKCGTMIIFDTLYCILQLCTRFNTCCHCARMYNGNHSHLLNYLRFKKTSRMLSAYYKIIISKNVNPNSSNMFLFKKQNTLRHRIETYTFIKIKRIFQLFSIFLCLYFFVFCILQRKLLSNFIQPPLNKNLQIIIQAIQHKFRISLKRILKQ